MALTWDWKDKTGYVTMKVGEKMYDYPMYKCNALMMWLGKQKIDGEDSYFLAGMFADVKHMNRCLGLVKGYKNLFEGRYSDIVKITMLGDTPYKNEIIKAFFKAFKNITISVVDTLE